MTNNYCVIMGGGIGSRFWPFSREAYPKQFLDFFGTGRTLLQMTYDRFAKIIPAENIYIVTNELYADLIKQQLPELDARQILLEPARRNTAPCIAYAAYHIRALNPNANMVVAPCDHLILKEEEFLDDVRKGLDFVDGQDILLTMGIRPSRPETGYGYIKYNKDNKEGESFSVEKFVEKPDLDTAKAYLADGSYLWNSGMFVWKVSTILSCFKKYMTSTYEGLLKIKASVGTADYQNTLEKEFPNLESQSVDYGIMEKASDIYTLAGNFGWDDVGSWLAVGRIKENDSEGNVVNGNVVTVNTQNCVIEGADKLIATVGLRDMIVVDTKDATLISTKENAGEIKKVLAKLREEEKNQYL